MPLDIHWFEAISSTNQTLWELVDQAAGEGTVAIAQQQHAGRGQWGRQWQSAPGGLYLSLALTPDLAAENSGQLTLCSAWGIATALRRYEVPVELKWPNDLVIYGQKLGGVLTETRITQGRIRQAIVGVGINWANPVPEVGINLQTIMAGRSHPSITSLEEVAAIGLSGLTQGYQTWQQQGIDAILPGYHAFLTNVGHSVKVDDHLGEVAGVSLNGELRVRLSSTDGVAATTEICLKPGTVSLGYGTSLGN